MVIKLIIKFPAEKVKSLPLKQIISLIDSGQFTLGLAELKRFLHKFPENSEGWTLLGHIKNNDDQANEAINAYQKALSISPENPKALTGLGIAFRKLGLDEAAQDNYRKALLLEPENPWALSSLAIIELKNYQDESALEHALKAYHKIPNDPYIAANLSVAYHYNDMPAKRDKLLKIAVKAGYKNEAEIKKFFTGEMTLRNQD